MPHERRKLPAVLQAALGRRFDCKVAYAKHSGLIHAEVADSLNYLHRFRNTAYHQGKRHDGILHALTLMYFDIACGLLRGQKMLFSTTDGYKTLPYRAKKYIPPSTWIRDAEIGSAFQRIADVARSLGETLVPDLHGDMERLIDETDRTLTFLEEDSFQPTTRDEAVLNAQLWPFISSDEAKKFALANGCPMNITVKGFIEWLAANYPWHARTDPVPGWRARLIGLRAETDRHRALKKYCDFVAQTAGLRASIDEAGYELDRGIQQAIDEARGK
jgi:hypothetical protein